MSQCTLNPTINWHHQIREKLLEAEDSDYHLRVLLNVINLLAACCEGENLFIESLCQNVISIEEIMKVHVHQV